MAEYRPHGGSDASHYYNRPRTDSEAVQAAGGNDVPTVQNEALTPVPPQTAVSLVGQNEQPVPLPSAEHQGINAGQQQVPQRSMPQQQIPQLQVPQQQIRQPVDPVQPPPMMPMMAPPPYYSEYYGAGVPQQYPYTYPVGQPQMLVPAVPVDQVKVTNQSSPLSFKVQCKASCNICTGWKGILEIAARVGVTVSYSVRVRSCKIAQQIKNQNSRIITCEYP